MVGVKAEILILHGIFFVDMHYKNFILEKIASFSMVHQHLQTH